MWNSPPERIEDSGGGLSERFFRNFSLPPGFMQDLWVKFSLLGRGCRFGFFDLAVKNSSNSGNFATIEK
jgi:hypothetical protein